MIDFKAATEKLQNKNGECCIPTKHYAFIDAIETFKDKVIKRQVHWICERYQNGYAFILLNGVTGQESWYVNDLVETLSQPTSCEFFTACLGCSNYPTLELDLSQMKSVIMQLHSQLD